MRRIIVITVCILSLSTPALFAQDGLIIQEEEVGICTMDGVISSSSEGYTGIGYVNVSDGTGIGMSWSFSVPAAGTYSFYCRYALGGSDKTSRDAGIIINNQIPADTLEFPHLSAEWTVWSSTDTVEVELDAGSNTIRLSSITHKGLPNIDYFHIFGSGISAVECTPSFTFSIDTNISDVGKVRYDPVQFLYEAGSEITVEATANSGSFFHSWSGEESSIENPFTFQIKENTNMEALFYPDGTTMDEDAIGYATIQHDNGTPYLLTGGSLGDTVIVTSKSDLLTYIEDDVPRVVILAAHLSGLSGEEIKIGSNKTLLGRTNAHLEGMRVGLQNARNVIIKDVRFSKVITFDALEINSNSQNIWIDHCEFFSDMDHGSDYYDGLLDIKNQSRFLTISWTKFHDHSKCILISSGPTQYGDTVIRATFHHNYFHDAGSRLPSFRFGKGHIFNNYYKNISTGINSRLNACIRVEKNYFQNAGIGVGMLYDIPKGAVELIDNEFVNTSYSEEPSCVLDVPYDYVSWLDNTADVPQLVSDSAGPRYPVINSIPRLVSDISALSLFPNPADENLNVGYRISKMQMVSISIIDIMGKETMIENDRHMTPGWHELEINTSEFPAGVYLLKLNTDNYVITRQLIIN